MTHIEPAKDQDRKDQFVLRLPQGMRKGIKASAALNERSMNAELIYLIKLGQQIQMRGAST